MIHEDQCGYVKGRYFAYNISKIEDCFQFCNNENNPGILLNIDFEKAFDSLNWKLIEKTLIHYNFGEVFINLFKLLYKNIKATVTNNGLFSDFFLWERGVSNKVVPCPPTCLF